MTNSFPKRTAEIQYRGFPHRGYLTEHRNASNGLALYYFPGDFVAGDAFELWLTAIEANNAPAILEHLVD